MNIPSTRTEPLDHAEEGSWWCGTHRYITVFYTINFSKFRGSEEWAQLCEWMQYHNIDPYDVPADSVMVVDRERHTIAYFVYVRDEFGRLIMEDEYNVKTDVQVEQGEAGPLPLPSILVRKTNE